ncbi:hypothetical protein LNV08_09215 [Paucibacter sp. TC2R-5]|uniref:hypothetical protein n=1 Tax=Paucibacter sp. TC2R-5 TaxID=2893555 RepID=UPI0021E4C323|nr:hypothetical protein [Paucibacter sp. TC2R-5]MCV2359155.1 hypothetical protein [Paucibacter sp. TC2R-5]
MSLLVQMFVPTTSFANDLVRASDFGRPDILLNSAAIIQKNGSDLIGRIDQQFDASSTDRTRNPIGDGNFAYLDQEGSRQEARLSQTGNLNQMLVKQSGQGNSVIAEQIGNGNSLKVTQDGIGNILTSKQVGDRNSVDVEQIGNGYRADITIYGNDNRSSVVQPEHGLTVTVILGTAELPVNGLTVKGTAYYPPK